MLHVNVYHCNHNVILRGNLRTWFWLGLVLISVQFSCEAVVLFGISRCDVVHCYFSVGFFIGSPVFRFSLTGSVKSQLDLITQTIYGE